MIAPRLTSIFAMGLLSCNILSPSSKIESTNPNTTELSHSDKVAQLFQHNSWEEIRKLRQSALKSQFERFDEGWKYFDRVPTGEEGLPLVLFKLLPDLQPEIFGPVDRPWSAFGMWIESRNNSGLPNGIGFRPLEIAKAQFLPTPDRGIKTPVDIVVAQCSLCHTGRLRHPDGKIEDIEGAPNNLFKATAFQSAMYNLGHSLLADPKKAKAEILEALSKKPLGWLYGDTSFVGQMRDRAQRDLFKIMGSPMLAKVGENLRIRGAGFSSYLNSVYSNDPSHITKAPISHIPGMADAFGSIPAFYPDRITKKTFGGLTDIPSVWNQGARANGQWAGDIASRFIRNALAALLLVTDVKRVDINAVAQIDTFVDVWNAPPYPFEVDLAAARRGSVLYESDCAECHVYKMRGESVQTRPEAATDPLRAMFFDPRAAAIVAELVEESCPVGKTISINGRREQPCNIGNQKIYAPQGDLPKEQIGYIAPHHDGLWARSPYLHNGSVPTIKHLLVPSLRPEKFVRGTLDYDTMNMGFNWDAAHIDPQLHPTSFVMQTSWQGLSNGGHDTILKRDWASEDSNLKDLIEFLKTL